jgi:ketosteroid isomerase-like protein
MSEQNVVRFRVPPLRGRSRRTTLERIGLRYPAVARLLRAAVLRLPNSSRLRREILARAIRDNAEAFACRDYDAFLVGLDPEIVVTNDAFVDTSIYYGTEGMREFLAMLEDVWGDYRIEPEVMVDLGDRYVLLARHRAHGRGSGVDVDHRVGLVGTWRDGMVVRFEFYWSAEQAFKAAGLSE